MSEQNKKRHRITFKEPTETLDDTGQPVVSWSTFRLNEPAEYTPMNGVEVMRGRQLQAGTKGVFKVNYRDGYSTQMKVLYNGDEYGIVAINQVDGLRRELEIMVIS